MISVLNVVIKIIVFYGWKNIYDLLVLYLNVLSPEGFKMS